MVALGILTLLAACGGGGMHDLEQYVKMVKAKKPGRIEPLPELKQVETFAYVANNRRNPFIPTQAVESDEIIQQGSGLAPDPNRRKEELEQFPLDSIRMVGTVDLSETVWGLVKTKDQTIYRIKVGNYMGLNHGQITNISEDKIELTEIIPKKPGGFKERQASVSLSE
ncbi:MAG: pilus assembly protein PilP [Gammaproteobacteria bacterium]|nr:pilus assembly protein PilP [Gammaproteobacteria bacterium]